MSGVRTRRPAASFGGLPLPKCRFVIGGAVKNRKSSSGPVHCVAVCVCWQGEGGQDPYFGLNLMTKIIMNRLLATAKYVFDMRE